MGTGKFPSVNIMKKAIEASGTQIVTVALRRVEVSDPDDHLMGAIDTKRYLLNLHIVQHQNKPFSNELVRLNLSHPYL